MELGNLCYAWAKYPKPSLRQAGHGSRRFPARVGLAVTLKTAGRAEISPSENVSLALLGGLLVSALISSPLTLAQEQAPRIERLELVTDQAVVGDGGNNWGGHQTRIVRTKDGLFTAYTTGKSDPPGAPWHPYDRSPRYWKLAMRQDHGWQVIAQGQSGREPVNLMAGPDGRLHIIAWPEGNPHLWSGMPTQGAIVMKSTPIPGPFFSGDWTYASAGVSSKGDLALVESPVDNEIPGRLIWGYLPSGGNQWQTGTIPVKERHAYTYVFPGPNGALSMTSTRDVKASLMGYPSSATTHSLGYVFNRVGCWSTEDVFKKPMLELQVDESIPTKEFPEVWACGTCVDTYVDAAGRMHVFYFFRGAGTKGKQVIRHAVLENGKVSKIAQVPEACGGYFATQGEKERDRPRYCRMLQDTTGRFYLLGTTAVIPADSVDGTTLGKPAPLDLKEYQVEYSGIAVAAPRGGTPLADFVDGVFPADNGRKVVYLRIRLR